MSNEMKLVSAKAKQLYESQFREGLEHGSLGRYVSIEPESRDHFLGNTFDEAVNAALEKYPERLTHTVRVGHRAALHLGVLMTRYSAGADQSRAASRKPAENPT